MNIIDTNGINYIFDQNIHLQDDYYLAPDVAEEVELTQLVRGNRIPEQITAIDEHHLFDESLYLNQYKSALNRFGGRSFYNMTGFGDISIIATVGMLVEKFDIQNKAQLFDTTEQIIIYTDDSGLTKRLKEEFALRNVLVEEKKNIK